MSRTFTSRPSCRTSTRGTTARAGVRNPPTNLDQSEETSTSRVRGRGVNSFGTTRPRARGGKMNDPNQGQGYGQSTNRNSNTVGGVGASEQQQDLASRGNYASGYTMFAPNQTRRQQVSQMAQRESQDYEQYRQANAVKHVSHVGIVGGGELTEDQARAKQANTHRAQRFMRQQKQDQQRQSKKREEELAIDKKRAEARTKAEQNAARQSLDAPADEVRRKREAFLRRVENMGPACTSEPAPPNQRMTQTSLRAPNNQTRPVESVLQ